MMKCVHKAAFTLIELLVAMAILAIIILMMARIFTESTRAFDMGLALADQNLKGRMILDFMAREISQAVADDVIGFKLDSDDMDLFGPGYTEDGDKLHFVSMSNILDESDERQTQEIIYWVEEMTDLPGRYRLRRTYKNGRDTMTCYEQPSPHKWWEEGGFDGWNERDLAENVAGFQVWCYTAPDAAAVFDYDSTGSKPEQINQLPLWIEISLMMFDEKDAIRAATMLEFNMPAEEIHDFTVKNARRFVTRINFVNRNGYAADK